MSRTLEQAVARFDAAEGIHVVAQWVSWPEYENFVTALRNLSKEAQTVQLFGSLREDYEKLWRIRRFVRTAPVEPSVVESEVLLARTPAAGAYGERLEETFDALDALCGSASPLAREIRAYLGGERRQIPPSPAVIQILTDRRVSRLYDPRSFSLDTGHSIHGLTTTEARRSEVADLMFVLGDPEDYDSNFKNWDARTRAVSWLFNAPSAKRIICLLLNDCRPFDVTRFEVWPSAGQFDPIIEGRRERIEFNLDYVPPPFAEPSAIERHPGEITVSASRVRLADGSSIYFSDAHGSKPRLLVRDEHGVEIDEIRSVSEIQRGSVLLINASEASRAFIRREADRILNEKYNDDVISSYREVVKRYKSALLAVDDVGELISRAKTRNISEDAVRQQLYRAALPDAFATQDSSRFFVFCSLLGLPTDNSQWEAVSRLQSANRAAGRTAKDQLRQAIATDSSLYERVLEPSLVTIEDPELGSIVVSAVVEDPVNVDEVGISILGNIRK